MSVHKIKLTEEERQGLTISTRAGRGWQKSMDKRYICRRCGARIFPTGRMGAPCPGCGHAGTGVEVRNG